MKTTLLLVGAALLALGAGAQAQNRNNGGNNNGSGNNGGNGRNNNNRGGNGGNGGAVFPLPEGVESVVSIDALNILIAQTNRDGQRDLFPIPVLHVYSGGIARLFGGSSIPTELFVTPGAFGSSNNGGNNGNGNGGGFGGNQNGGFGGGLGNNGGGGFGGGFGGGIGSFQMRPSLRRRN